MTDTPPEPGRVDLRALTDPADPLQADRVVQAALVRAALGPRPARRVAHLTALLAAAALLLVAAGVLLLAPGRQAPEEPAGLIADWAASSHVPTNGELLAAFGGYRP
jgi:hypothetical protein